jgi:hypothetical protein
MAQQWSGGRARKRQADRARDGSDVSNFTCLFAFHRPAVPDIGLRAFSPLAGNPG